MAQHTLSTQMDIDASAEQVWAVLTDFAAYPQWNPFIQTIGGPLRVGEKLRVCIARPGGKPMRFCPTLLAVEPGRQLRWLGRWLVPGLFDGEHVFDLTPLAPQRVRLTHSEHFSGWLVGWAKASLEGSTRAGFEAMNQALKARAQVPSLPA